MITNIPANKRITYVYDGVGNRRFVATASQPRTGFAGHVCCTTNIRDCENRLVAKQQPTGNQTMIYAADHHRVQRTDVTGSFASRWDHENVIRETGATNNDYILQPETYGNLLAWHDGSTPYIISWDGQQSVRRATDATGTQTGLWLYDAWGVPLTNPPLPPFGYVGRLGYASDGYVRRCYLSVNLGRWLGKRPPRYVRRLPMYCFARNAPLLPIAFFDDVNSDELTVMIEPVQAFLEGKSCGQRSIRWKFRLSSKRHCAGFFVQRVVVHCDIKDCPPKPKKKQSVPPPACPTSPPSQAAFFYYEAWYVPDGRDTATAASDVKWTDQARGTCKKWKCGAVRQLGSAAFFCITQTGNIDGIKDPPPPPEIPMVPPWSRYQKYGQGECATSPFNLPSTGTTPPFWEEPLAGPADRSFQLVYACCDCYQMSCSATASPSKRQ